MFGRRSPPAHRADQRPARGAPDEAGRLRAKRRILIWATIGALLVGVLEFAQPLDDYYRLTRNRFMPQAPSGRIVVIGIDERSVERFGAWPWSRDLYARIIDRANAMGAKRIFFDVFFNSPTTVKNDRALASAIGQAGNVYLPVSYTRTGEGRRSKFPLPLLRREAKLVTIWTTYSPLVMVKSYPYALTFDGLDVPSMAAEMADVQGPVGQRFSIDYRTDLKRIPRYSAADLLTGKIPRRALQGRDIVIGLTSIDMGDVFMVPGRGLINGVFLNVAGAETLMRGRPINVGWLFPLLVSLGLTIVHISARSALVRRMALSVALAGLTLGAFVADEHLIFIEVMPALLLIGIVAGWAAWINFRSSYKVRGNLNAVSGLPNLNALRDGNIEAGATLVAARVRNFAEISSALPPDAERALVEQITARLALGARGARIYQGDEGVFVWSSSVELAGSDQLDALHALFRSPALVDGRPIDLSVTFGTDVDETRSLANRIGATLVAADEAAAEGLRWKAYDPAKLADAEWKLSLLGRLDAAIDSGEIWVAYQPQIELATGRICGAEALVRWSHPEKGEVSPAEFVLAAEQHDRIDKLTDFVLTDAVRTAAAFARRGIAFDVAVNISARLLERRGLVDRVRRHLADSGLDPARLTLEVTESAAMTSGRSSIRTLEEIGSLGINVSIDDYGTGFSTLDYFKRIPATEVKIDRGFVATIDRNASDRLMVRSTIELAHSLGRSVVAEGVESSEILAELTNLGCDKAQGYLIGRPMKMVNLTRLVLADKKSRAA